ncbi:hypothetical protein DBR47_18645 [Paucibacter sp. KBW04]|uniref:low temperature requirement protein A n=1 Tax=Paucibacter sp. KBW04 TaxID=2153361 RepID=UPI000F584820|nr:low temperature requirement protein A [Paucibacter sp. KBW04]RQO55894.1 hypothetical protein DBR47_18645 [Paucibacter sp. KBW04]
MTSPSQALATASTHSLRQRGTSGPKVSYAELFFDLVYVFAVTQTSHYLLTHLSLEGALQTLLLWFAVWLGWQYTCWVSNWFDPEMMPVRSLLFAAMLLALPMAAALPYAFEPGGGWVFAGCFVTLQVGRTLWVLFMLGAGHALTPNFQRILGWTLIASAFWLAGAACDDTHGRMALWALAAASEYISPMFGLWLPGLGRSQTSDWTIDGGHLAERCQLFIIVALGESILLTGATFSEAKTWDSWTVAAFACAFVTALAMWWLYFDTSSKEASHAIEHADDPGRLGAYFHYIHVLIVAGIIVAAVGSELLIAHPHAALEGKSLAVMLGSFVFFIAGNALFRRIVLGRWAPSLMFSLLVLPLLAYIGHGWPLIWVAGLLTLLIAGVALFDSCLQRH